MTVLQMAMRLLGLVMGDILAIGSVLQRPLHLMLSNLASLNVVLVEAVEAVLASHVEMGVRNRKFFVMIVKGPNQRSDYHINPGNEWFFQLRGQLILHIVDERSIEPFQKFQEIILNDGDVFMLPSHTPHCPVRSPGSIGLVLERIRKVDEMDILRWYCEMCKESLHEIAVHCVDHQLGAIFTPLIQAYYANEVWRTCKKCLHINSVPKT